MMKELLRSWDVGDVSAIEPIPSYGGKTSLVKMVDGRCFILKGKPDLAHVEREFTLLSRLSQAGAPVAVPIRTTDGAPCTSSKGTIHCLYPRLPGKPIAEHYAGDAPGRAQALGKAIGRLHTYLLACEALGGFGELKLLEQIRTWAMPCVRKNRSVVGGDSIERIWAAVDPEMDSLYNELPKQLIHRDPNPQNMLFDDGKLTGFVDFDMVVRGPRVFDVCYCASSLLVSGFEDPAKVEKWPGLFHFLVRGYQEVFPLTSPERLALYGTLAAIELLFMAFSLETQAEGAARCNARVLRWLSANRECLVA